MSTILSDTFQTNQTALLLLFLVPNKLSII
jgi:hypothetical protein